MRRAPLALGLLLALAAPAAAEDGPSAEPPRAADGAGDLTPEEISALRRRLPEWDVLEQAARERIARNIRVWRSMTPEERAKVLERARRLERAGSVAKQEFAERLARLGRLPGDDRRHARAGRHFVRAAGLAVLRSLPEGARATVEALPEREHAELEVCVSWVWRRTAVDALARRPLSEVTLPADAPEALRRRLEKAMEAARAQGGDAAPADARRVVAAIVFEDRLRARLREAGAGVEGTRGRDGRALVERLANEMRSEDSEVFDAVLRTVSEAAARGPEGLVALCGPRPPRPPERRFPSPRDRALADLVRSLEARRAALADVGAETLAQADAFEARLLEALRVPRAEVDALERARTKDERGEVLRRILRRFP